MNLADFTDVIANKPLFTYCSGLLIILYSLNFVLKDCTETIGLVTANTLITNNYVWNLVTSCFYESNPIKLFLDIVGLLLVTKSLPIPCLEQFGLYFIFSVLACTIGTSTYCFVRFFSTSKEETLVTPIYGFCGVLVTVAMFARQQLRNESVHAALPMITYHNLPVLIVAVQLFLCAVYLDFLATDLPFTVIALFFSWSYLRFYYKFGESELWGDKADDFSFVTMFPERLHIVVVPFTTAFYNIVALIGLFPPLDPVERKTYHHLRSISDANPSASNTNSSVSQLGSTDSGFNTAVVDSPAKTDLVAERRRAKAMKLLDAKMAELSQDPEGWDDVGTMEELQQFPAGHVELSKLKV